MTSALRARNNADLQALCITVPLNASHIRLVTTVVAASLVFGMTVQVPLIFYSDLFVPLDKPIHSSPSSVSYLFSWSLASVA